MTNRHATRAGFQALWLVVSLAAAGGLIWFGLGPGGWFRAQAEAGLAGAEVQRGPLRISVTERGSLKAADSVVLKSEIEGSTTILWLIDEGVTVAEGDLVCELDVTKLIDDRFQREISVRNAEASFIKSKQAFEIQKSQNESDIAKAEQNLAFARQDLVKFREGERTKMVKEAEESITLAEEEDARAQERLRWSLELEAKGIITGTELEADRLSANRAAILLDQAKRDRDLLMIFQLQRDEDELSANLAEAERELVRVKLQAAARLVDYEAAMNTDEAKLKLEQDKLSDVNQQIDRGKLYAPRAGMLVYAKEPGGSRYGREDPIAEGTQVRERQELITIPSAQGMIAEVSLHESVLKQVRAGLSCIVKVDAVPGREYHGRVSFVALLPDQNSWWANPNQRLYRTEVKVADTSQEMRPGMSCAVEILVEELEDAIYAPVQSIFRHGGENIAFVHRPASSDGYEVRPVTVGRYNDRWVQIEVGLDPGEIVLLSQPATFTLQAEVQGGAQRSPAESGPEAGSHGAPAAAPAAAAADVHPSQAEGERPSAEQIEAFHRARAQIGEEAGDESGEGGGAARARPTPEQIEAWRKLREQGGGQAPSQGSSE